MSVKTTLENLMKICKIKINISLVHICQVCGYKDNICFCHKSEFYDKSYKNIVILQNLCD